MDIFTFTLTFYRYTHTCMGNTHRTELNKLKNEHKIITLSKIQLTEKPSFQRWKIKSWEESTIDAGNLFHNIWECNSLIEFWNFHIYFEITQTKVPLSFGYHKALCIILMKQTKVFVPYFSMEKSPLLWT